MTMLKQIGRCIISINYVIEQSSAMSDSNVRWMLHNTLNLMQMDLIIMVDEDKAIPVAYVEACKMLQRAIYSKRGDALEFAAAAVAELNKVIK